MVESTNKGIRTYLSGIAEEMKYLRISGTSTSALLPNRNCLDRTFPTPLQLPSRSGGCPSHPTVPVRKQYWVSQQHVIWNEIRMIPEPARPIQPRAPCCTYPSTKSNDSCGFITSSVCGMLASVLFCTAGE